METQAPYEHVVRSLIIDDETDTCSLLGHLLSKRNILNESAYNITDSKQLLKSQKFDIIFLDNHLPDGKGIDFIPYLKDISPRPKIIMITASPDLPARHNLLKRGVDWFLPKPLHTKSINNVIDQILEKDSGHLVNSNMMNFKVSFLFGNKNEHADVVKSVLGNRTDYKIYPNSPEIIRHFGKEIILFKENDSFSVNTSSDLAYNEYVNAVTNAIRRLD